MRRGGRVYGVRQGEGERGGRHREEPQVANEAAGILLALAAGGFNQPLRAECQGGVSHPLSQGHQTLSCRGEDTGVRLVGRFILKTRSKGWSAHKHEKYWRVSSVKDRFTKQHVFKRKVQNKAATFSQRHACFLNFTEDPVFFVMEWTERQ